MPLYIFKRLFKNMSMEQLKGCIKSNIKLKHIMVHISHN